jgi:uncharacterized protein
MKSHALITGASKGLGAEFARQLAQRGYSVVVVARSEDALRKLLLQLPAGDHHAVPMDLSAPDAPVKLWQVCQDRQVHVEILINNAGFGALSAFHDQSPERLQEMVFLNCSSVVQLARFFTPAMAKRGWGYVLNVASIAAFAPTPNFTVYAATKAFVLSFSAALRAELQPKAIRVTALCPGPTRTEFFRTPDMTENSFGLAFMDAETVVKAGLDGLFAGKARVVPGFRNRLLTWLCAFTPTDLIAQAGARLVNAKPTKR